MVRLFVGLEIPETMYPELEFAQAGVEEAHWQRNDQLHLTLAFIGDTSNNIMREIEGELARITFDPFDLRLSGVGMFGKPGSPKALWAGVEDKAPLLKLHEKIMHILEPLGLDLDQRKYKPHVTLARFKKHAQSRVGDWLALNDTLRSHKETISHFSLFSSQMTSNGSYFDVESRFGQILASEADMVDFQVVVPA